MAGRAVSAAEGRVVLGWLEFARLGTDELVLPSKLDTGADNSSLSAKQVVQFQREGQSWVRFTVPNDEGPAVVFERPLERIAKIKRSGTKSEERPVIVMEVCVAKVFRRVEVNLTDRSHLDYKLLIGRSFLAGAILVDSSSTFTTDPACPA